MATNEKTYCGYIVKLYKTVNSHMESRASKDTEYMVWMNYDGMKIIPIEHFEKYGKSLDVAVLEEIDITCERQKILLYSLDDTKDIFGINDKEKYKEFPVIVLTMLKFYDDKMEKENIQEILEKLKDEAHMEFEIMGTLSANDFVIVFRGNSYNAINNIIFQLRSAMCHAKKPLSTTYSILGIYKADVENWNGDTDVYASVRIALDAVKNPYDIFKEYEKFNNQKKALDSYGTYTTYGKFDIGVEGNVAKNKQNFLELYGGDGIFSGEEKYIYMTNTRFLNKNYPMLESSQEDVKYLNELMDKEKVLLEKDREKAQQLIEQLKKVGVSEKLQQSVLRLILRVYQSNVSIYTSHDTNEFYKLLDALMGLLQRWGTESNCQETIAEMVISLNVLLDNRISANIRDFEVPHRSLRFSGASAKLLIAYSNVANELVKMMEQGNSRETKIKREVFVTSDIDSKIKTKLFISRDEECLFFNIRIPIDMMFNVQYVITWLLHEIGHFVTIQFDPKQRNRAFFQSAIAMFNLLLENNKSIHTHDILADIEFQKLCSSKCCSKYHNCEHKEECKQESLREYAMLLQNYWRMYILESGQKANRFIPADKKGDVMRGMERICLQICNAYEEAIADVFMIEVLNISHCSQYLKILVEYFKNNKIDVANEMSPNLLIRIVAILMTISNTVKGVKDNLQEFTNYIEKIKDESSEKEKEVAQLCTALLKKKTFFYSARSLHEYLKQEVVCKIRTLCDDVTGYDAKEKLLGLYQKMHDKPEDFQNYIDFVEKYN